MHLLLLIESFPPETKSASTLYWELAESLVKKGHRVSVIARLPRHSIAQGLAAAEYPARENISGVEVYRRRTPPLAQNVPLLRGFEHFITAWLFFWGGLKVRDFDAILVYSPPLPLGLTGYLLGKLRQKPVIVNVQDLFPQGIIDLGLLKNKVIIALTRAIESFVYKKAGLITVHSAGNKDYIVKKGRRPEDIEVIYNWVDTELIRPLPQINEFSRRHGLAGRFVVSYAGTIGFAQGLEVMIDTAERLKANKDIVFALVGDGAKKAELEERAKKLGLPNVVFIKIQPLQVYPQVLGASALSLIMLPKALTIPAVPGKLLSIMAAGRPVIASVPLAGDAPKLIGEYKCGVCVPPEDPAELAKAVINLYNNKSLCEELGKNGRRAAEAVFSREAAVDKYIRVFAKITSKIRVEGQ
jgi:colanic acid biosynthesis glycosyl transferase WcaI